MKVHIFDRNLQISAFDFKDNKFNIENCASFFSRPKFRIRLLG